MFEAEFQKEVERQIAARQANASASLAERMGAPQRQEDTRYNRFAIEGDDENNTLMWRQMMTDCAYYFDQPSIEDENRMRSQLQNRYDSLLQPGWRAPLTSRRDLLTWACNQVNNNF